MFATTIRLLALPLLVLGLVLVAGCDDEQVTGEEGRVRRETREVLENIRKDLDSITPERKEQLVRRCVNAVEQLRKNNDPQADRLLDFCDSLEDTNPNTPAAWDDIRRRLDELIAHYRR